MAKARKKAVRRAIYDQNYYKAQAMLRDPWFKEKQAWLLERFVEVGCPLPKRPFKKYVDYMAWNERFWNRYSEMQKSPEYLEATQRITGGKQTMSSEEYYALEEFREKYLPPLYGQVFREILQHFNIPGDDKGFRDFLEFYFFFGQKEYHTTPFSISWRRADPDSEPELLIKIYAHTTQEDFMRHWDWIAAEQKSSFKDRTEKNKEWETFERDLAIYNLYKKLRASGEKRRLGMVALDKDIWAQMHNTQPKLTIGNIRSIVTRTRKRLGEL